jgi:programmed cell death protein 5
LVVSAEEQELEAIRRRKLAELAQHQQAAAAHQQQAEAVEAQRQTLMRSILTPDARERLGRLRTAFPDIAASVEDQLLALYSSGRLRNQVDDATLKRILEQVVPRKRDINITRR